MADTDRIKRNIGKMIDAGAPRADIDAYLSSEGVPVVRGRVKRALPAPDLDASLWGPGSRGD
mgnify:CR=1 FL=1